MPEENYAICNICGDTRPDFLCVYFSTVYAVDKRRLLLVCDKCEAELQGDRWTLNDCDTDTVENSLITHGCDD